MAIITDPDDPRWHLWRTFTSRQEAMAEARATAAAEQLLLRVVGVDVYVREPRSASDWRRFLDVMQSGDVASKQESQGYVSDYAAMAWPEPDSHEKEMAFCGLCSGFGHSPLGSTCPVCMGAGEVAV